MKRYAWAVLGLGLWAVAVGPGAAPVVGQTPPPAPVAGQTLQPTIELKQNYPNPFSAATTIPFAVSGEAFVNGHRPVVSVKIYNVLAQLVAVAVLEPGGEPLDNLSVSCGNPTGCSYSGHWDGMVHPTGRPAAAGVYIYQLVVDGRRFTKKMIVLK